MPRIVNTLRQEEMWYGQDSLPYRIVNMDNQHIVNVLDFLRRRASQLKLQHYWDEFLELNDIPDDEVGPDSERAFIQWLGKNPAIEANPARWLESMPLVRALSKELRRRGVVDGDVVRVRYDEELEEDSDDTDGRAVDAHSGLRDRPALG